MGPIVLALVAAAAAWGIYKAATGGLSDAKFVIEISGEGRQGVSVRGGVPGKSEQDVVEFISGLELDPGAKIWCVPDGGTLRLRFSGDIPAHLQQRMRNYFMN